MDKKQNWSILGLLNERKYRSQKEALLNIDVTDYLVKWPSQKKKKRFALCPWQSWIRVYLIQRHTQSGDLDGLLQSQSHYQTSRLDWLKLSSLSKISKSASGATCGWLRALACSSGRSCSVPTKFEVTFWRRSLGIPWLTQEFRREAKA